MLARTRSSKHHCPHRAGKYVIRHDRAAGAGVVAHRHPPPAPAADDQSLQQGGAFAGRPGVCGRGRGRRRWRPAPAGWPGTGPGDVARVVVVDEGRSIRRPAWTGCGGARPGRWCGGRGRRRTHRRSRGCAGPSAPVVGERAASTARRCGVRCGAGRGRSAAAARKALTTAKAEPVAVKVSNSRRQRAGTPASGSRVTCAGGVVDQADRQRQAQLAAAGLGQDPAAQPGPQEMQFCLAELAFHPQEEAVVEAGRVIEPVLVQIRVSLWAQIRSSRCQSAFCSAYGFMPRRDEEFLPRW